MRLGLFLILPQPAGVSQAQVFASALEDAVLAEHLGFDGVWVTEHHGSAYGLAAAPSVIAAAIAARTERVAIGYAVNVTPLHNPLRLADEIATVDHLSGGRVIAGFGAGYSPVEYRHLGVAFADRHRRHRDAVAAVIDHWCGSPGLRPQQRPHPPVAVTGAASETASWAARSGFWLLTLGDERQTERLHHAYRQSQHGHPAPRKTTGTAQGTVRGGPGAQTSAAKPETARPGRFGLLRSICVVDEAAAADDAAGQVRAAIRWTLEHRNRMVEQPPPTEQEVAAYRGQRTVVGSADLLRRTLHRLAALGVDELLCWCRWGSLATPAVHATMRALATCAPALRRRSRCESRG